MTWIRFKGMSRTTGLSAAPTAPPATGGRLCLWRRRVKDGAWGEIRKAEKGRNERRNAIKRDARREGKGVNGGLCRGGASLVRSAGEARRNALLRFAGALPPSCLHHHGRPRGAAHTVNEGHWRFAVGDRSHGGGWLEGRPGLPLAGGRTPPRGRAERHQEHQDNYSGDGKNTPLPARSSSLPAPRSPLPAPRSLLPAPCSRTSGVSLHRPPILCPRMVD